MLLPAGRNHPRCQSEDRQPRGSRPLRPGDTEWLHPALRPALPSPRPTNLQAHTRAPKADTSGPALPAVGNHPPSVHFHHWGPGVTVERFYAKNNKHLTQKADQDLQRPANRWLFSAPPTGLTTHSHGGGASSQWLRKAHTGCEQTEREGGPRGPRGQHGSPETSEPAAHRS